MSFKETKIVTMGGIKMMARKAHCPNFNHGRTNVPVRNCPVCGEVVNSKISQKVCSEGKHAKGRREQNAYCIDCGAQLT